jgi:hypothetical protein
MCAKHSISSLRRSLRWIPDLLAGESRLVVRDDDRVWFPAPAAGALPTRHGRLSAGQSWRDQRVAAQINKQSEAAAPIRFRALS